MGDEFNQLARIQNAGMPDASQMSTMLQMAEALYNSGLLPAHIKSSQAAFAVIQKGTELGIPPMHALSNIVVIQGKPTANAELMLALIYRDHGDNAVQFTNSNATVCEVAYKRRNWANYQKHQFTILDAKTAGLSGGNWAKYPAAMLRARCISAVARMAFPDTIGGMYTPEELDAAVEVDIDGSVLYDDRETLKASGELAWSIGKGSREISDATVDVDGNVVTEDGEIVGLFERIEKTEADPVLFEEFKRRLANADTLDELGQEGAWAERVNLTQPAAVEAFNARRKELRLANVNAAQPELVGVE